MSPLPAFLVSLFLCCLSLLAHEPQFDSIDYTNPSNYLAWPSSLGDAKAIRQQASQLVGDSERETIRNVLNWMSQTLRYDDQKAYVWRNYDDSIREKAYGGCADQGIVCGVLLKAAGVPAVWVKTMDVTWIWDFKKGRHFESWSGHVFLEVWVEHKWMLLDPGGAKLYTDYRPQERLLPGNRFAYDKGNDPMAMIMSLQWEDWKRQTETYFRALDESLLPVDTVAVADLNPGAFVAGNSPVYQTMTQMASDAGLLVKKSFNNDYDVWLTQAQGHLLLVETHDGKPIVPRDTLEKHFPGCLSALRQRDGTVQVAATTIVFLDFSRPLPDLNLAVKNATATHSRLANNSHPLPSQTNSPSFLH